MADTKFSDHSGNNKIGQYELLIIPTKVCVYNCNKNHADHQDFYPTSTKSWIMHGDRHSSGECKVVN